MLNLFDWTAAGTLVIALFTALAAGAAAFGAVATRRAADAQVFIELSREYASREMSEALRDLGDWGKSFSASGAPFKQAADNWASDLHSGHASAEAIRRNEQRRLVAHFFWNASCLIDSRYIRGGLRVEIVSHAGKRVMRDVVIPLEMAHRSRIGSDPKNAAGVEARFLRVFFPDG